MSQLLDQIRTARLPRDRALYSKVGCVAVSSEERPADIPAPFATRYRVSVTLEVHYTVNNDDMYGKVLCEQQARTALAHAAYYDVRASLHEMIPTVLELREEVRTLDGMDALRKLQRQIDDLLRSISA